MAYEIARHGVAQLLPDGQIVLSIVEQLKTTERSAAAALRKVAEQGAKLSPKDQEELSDTIHFRLEHLYARAAQEGKLEQAARMLDRRAKLAGLLAKDRSKKPEEQEPDEFDGRSLEELRYYRENGYWPEDKPAANVVPIDPLARLRGKKQA
jgi:hypothetical protein